MSDKLKKDIIKCRDKEDAADIAEELTKLNIEWDFAYEVQGEKGIFIECTISDRKETDNGNT